MNHRSIAASKFESCAAFRHSQGVGCSVSRFRDALCLLRKADVDEWPGSEAVVAICGVVNGSIDRSCGPFARSDRTDRDRHVLPINRQ